MSNFPIGLDVMSDAIAEAFLTAIKSADDPYKKYVPIVSTETGWSIYLTDDIVEPSMYNEVIHILDQADYGDIIRFYISTPGGNAATAELLHSAIRNTRAHTVAVATGVVASAGTVICFACKEFYVSPNAMFLIHEGSTGVSGKFSDVRAYQEFSTKHLKEFFACTYEGILEEQELNSALKGEELWFTGKEITARLAATGKKVTIYGKPN